MLCNPVPVGGYSSRLGGPRSRYSPKPEPTCLGVPQMSSSPSCLENFYSSFKTQLKQRFLVFLWEAPLSLIPGPRSVNILPRVCSGLAEHSNR